MKRAVGKYDHLIDHTHDERRLPPYDRRRDGVVAGVVVTLGVVMFGCALLVYMAAIDTREWIGQQERAWLRNGGNR